MMAVRNTASFQVYHNVDSSGSDFSSSSSSSENSDTPLRRFNRLLRSSVARHWAYFRKDRPALKSRGRSISDAGLCSIVDNESEPEFNVTPGKPRRSIQTRSSFQTITSAGITRATIPKLYLTSASGSSAVALEEGSDGSDTERPRRHRHHLRVPTPALVGQSTGNFAAGAAVGGCGAPRSAPATPLQLEPAQTRPMKHEKQAVKPLSSSAPSVRPPPVGAPTGGGVSDASEGKTPSKARQKKFFRHFPQVGPEERVLNYYSCALVGDILLQGHLYITKNYFAFYSNVFGYVTKLLIPTSSVLRVTKEKMARIIPNAVGVCTRDERHVFGSLLSRDATHRLMTRVWKQARHDTPAAPPPAPYSCFTDPRVSEAELDGSEYSLDETSSAGGGDATDGPRVRGETPKRTHPEREQAIVSGPGAAVIQPALLTGAVAAPPPRPRGGLARALLIGAALLLALSAMFLARRLYETTYHAEDELAKLSGSELYSELVRWRARLHGRAATELQAFLSTNLLLLTKVRQSLEALSGVILTDMAQAGADAAINIDVPNETAFS